MRKLRVVFKGEMYAVQEYRPGIKFFRAPGWRDLFTYASSEICIAKVQHLIREGEVIYETETPKVQHPGSQS